MSDAQAQYDRAMSDIRKQLTLAQGGQGAENRAQAAYKALVREGLAPRLRSKYRTGRRMKQLR